MSGNTGNMLKNSFVGGVGFGAGSALAGDLVNKIFVSYLSSPCRLDRREREREATFAYVAQSVLIYWCVSVPYYSDSGIPPWIYTLQCRFTGWLFDAMHSGTNRTRSAFVNGQSTCDPL